MGRVMGRLVALAVFAALVSCQPPAPPSPDRPQTVVLAPFPPAPHAVDAGPVDAEAPDSFTSVAYAGDGTLVVTGRRSLLARAPGGTVVRHAIPSDANVQVSDELPGVLLGGGEDKDSVLLATPTLQTLYSGASNVASLVMANVAVIALPGELLVQGPSGLLHLALPAEATRINGVGLLASGKRANVAYAFDVDGGGEAIAGALYDAQTGARVGAGLPISQTGGIPLSAHAGLTGFVVDQHRIRRLALDTGKVTRQTVVRCAADREVGNPTASPDGSLLLVTCGDDGVVLDGATLAERRRIPSIIPGCDNGPILGGTILPDGHTLWIGGCGGEAKLDLAAGRYRCADGTGLLGAPYMGMMMPGTGRGWQLPADRRNVPACGGQTDSGAFGRSNDYKLVYGDPMTIEGPGGRIEFEGGTIPVAAPDEHSFAYLHEGHVVVRALPGGARVADLMP